MIPYYFAGAALIFALVAVILAGSAARNAIRAAQYCEQNNKRSKIVQLECELTEIADDLAALRKSFSKLRSRYTMRENREAKKTPQEPAQHDDTPEGRDAARAELEKELQQKGMLHARVHQIGVKSGN